MKRTLLLLLLANPMFARAIYSNWCQDGNQQITTAGISSSSSTPVQRSYPACTVTVFQSDGSTLASIFSDNIGTPKSNPFTLSGSNGRYSFYADQGLYVIRHSGTGIMTPFTFGIFMPFDGSGGGFISALNGLTASSQTFATGTAGTNFGIVSSGSTHTFNLPSASSSSRGLLTSADWTTFNAKQGPLIFTSPLVNTANTVALTLPITISQGGCGQITQLLCFNALSPLTTKGDDLAFDGTNNIRLGIGANNTILVADTAQASGKKWASVLTACPTCNFSAAPLATNGVVIGSAGTQAEQTITVDTTTTHVLHGGTPPSFGPVGPTTDIPNTPTWQTFTVTAIANGINGCANANGCWQVNGVLGANKAAALTQSVVLFQLPANGYAQAFRYKTALACTGTATLKAGLGTASSSDFYLVSSTGYDLKAAVSATNISTALPLAFGSDTSAAVNVVSSLTATTNNIDQITAGCSYSISVEWSVLP